MREQSLPIEGCRCSFLAREHRVRVTERFVGTEIGGKEINAALTYYHANREEVEAARATDEAAGDQAENEHCGSPQAGRRQFVSAW